MYVRKSTKGHGTNNIIEGGNVSGERVILIEDHITTGESSINAINALRSQGAIVHDVLSITGYGFGYVFKAFRGFRLKATYTGRFRSSVG